jgi:di/tricarboxylate transporter
MGIFLENQCYDQIFAKASSSISKKRQIVAKFFGENIFKTITLVHGQVNVLKTGIFQRFAQKI